MLTNLSIATLSFWGAYIALHLALISHSGILMLVLVGWLLFGASAAMAKPTGINWGIRLSGSLVLGLLAVLLTTLLPNANLWSAIWNWSILLVFVAICTGITGNASGHGR